MKPFETEKEKAKYLKKIKLKIYLLVCFIFASIVGWLIVYRFTESESFYKGDCLLFKNADILKIVKLSPYEEVYQLEILYSKVENQDFLSSRITKTKNEIISSLKKKIECP